jgi:hypothetical protein
MTFSGLSECQLRLTGQGLCEMSAQARGCADCQLVGCEDVCGRGPYISMIPYVALLRCKGDVNELFCLRFKFQLTLAGQCTSNFVLAINQRGKDFATTAKSELILQFLFFQKRKRLDKAGLGTTAAVHSDSRGVRRLKSCSVYLSMSALARWLFFSPYALHWRLWRDVMSTYFEVPQ